MYSHKILSSAGYFSPLLKRVSQHTHSNFSYAHQRVLWLIESTQEHVVVMQRSIPSDFRAKKFMINSAQRFLKMLDVGTDREPTYEGLKNIKHLNDTLIETLRLHPAVPVSFFPKHNSRYLSPSLFSLSRKPRLLIRYHSSTSATL